MDQVNSWQMRTALLCFVVVIVLAVQYWFAASFIKRYEASLFFFVSWPLSLALLYFAHTFGYGKTILQSVVSGAALGYLVSLFVHPTLDALFVPNALLTQMYFFQKDPIAASILFFGGHFLLGGWLAGIGLSLLLNCVRSAHA